MLFDDTAGGCVAYYFGQNFDGSVRPLAVGGCVVVAEDCGTAGDFVDAEVLGHLVHGQRNWDGFGCVGWYGTKYGWDHQLMNIQNKESVAGLGGDIPLPRLY